MSKRVGVFGGSFNPIHFGHINSILSVKEKMSLDHVKVVPSFQTPGKDPVESPNSTERLELVELGLQTYNEDATVDALELTRGGVSYTIESLREFKSSYPDDEFYLIVGLDQFQSFDQWKDFAEIFKYSNLVVTSRPGFYFPLTLSDFPEGLRELIDSFDGYTSLLKGGSQIYFVRLEDQDISSSEIRRRVRLNQSIQKYVPLEVENYIKNKDLYSFSDVPDVDSEKLVKSIHEIVAEFGGNHPICFDLRDQNQVTDFNFIVSTTNRRANESLAEKIRDTLRDELGIRPFAFDPGADGNWIVVDYGSAIVHLFFEPFRHVYGLENLWSDYPELKM